MSERTLPSQFLHHFVETIADELGQDNLSTVLEKAGLSDDWVESSRWDTLDGSKAAVAYTGLQKAVRTYYGRGARGILLRVGSNLWRRLLDDASLAVKAQSRIIFGLPIKARRKAALEMLARLMGNQRDDVTVHTLDWDLLLADKVSPGTVELNEDERICYVTLGLIRECLYWATGQEHDIEETSCRAKGEEACEFTITIGG